MLPESTPVLPGGPAHMNEHKHRHEHGSLECGGQQKSMEGKPILKPWCSVDEDYLVPLQRNIATFD